ncbi:Concanavalin A-like lectin/glucanase, subgroup [Artemisia annua]|uniref:Concanavalin A-like lectin/glucanase, subgroup n=1 Tax=Artemisia annua TaxID=35608 RepID=A0A2U1QC77_ARTAN|nr:Concanavalin A-like lectin/glucanase, subgroup [Artemisia annua]
MDLLKGEFYYLKLRKDEALGGSKMLQATTGFSDANLLKHGHSGDIFSGKLEDGISVVIKKIDMRSSRKDCYMTEVEFFSTCTHTRFVPFLGHCLEHEIEKLLVYKHMPNRDLSNSLYRSTSLEDDGLQSLDWITRLKIAIGAAEALAYLLVVRCPHIVLVLTVKKIQTSSTKYKVAVTMLLLVLVVIFSPLQN